MNEYHRKVPSGTIRIIKQRSLTYILTQLVLDDIFSRKNIGYLKWYPIV